MIRKLCLVVAAAVLLAVPASASAYWPWGGGFGGGPWGYGNGFSSYGSGYIPAPPYFSVFPPVYYSHQITARPYGASPYAWPAGFSPLTVAPRYEAAPPPEPLMIMNPYVKGAAAPAAASAAAEPLHIANPYAQLAR